MRLFQALCRRKHMPNGHIWRGKNRLTKPVTVSDLQKLRNDFEIEEKNMFYLRHSYLTPEQSFGHARALGKNEENYIKLIMKKKEFKDNITIESQLGHLRYGETWE
ncbi:ribosomal protein 63, mitochondrial [Asbolus verrucosus]|uniref:Ribosomal protein 63, mitochondrial n=1 Tax=Asbolus verrucosus TaxID=1661398 RepID=A0A482VJB3_ASBVE|nr:ribosomal protein 63, mitochondrial [Asbolus verrucosus]